MTRDGADPAAGKRSSDRAAAGARPHHAVLPGKRVRAQHAQRDLQPEPARHGRVAHGPRPHAARGRREESDLGGRKGGAAGHQEDPQALRGPAVEAHPGEPRGAGPDGEVPPADRGRRDA